MKFLLASFLLCFSLSGFSQKGWNWKKLFLIKDESYYYIPEGLKKYGDYISMHIKIEYKNQVNKEYINAMKKEFPQLGPKLDSLSYTIAQYWFRCDQKTYSFRRVFFCKSNNSVIHETFLPDKWVKVQAKSRIAVLFYESCKLAK